MSTTPLWRRPIWILGHLVALTACLLFVRLGLWQLDRLDEKQARNEVIEARGEAPPVDVLEVIRTDEAEYRRVTAAGEWAVEDEVTIRNRSLQGSVGRHVVTPLVLEDGSWLYVNRGWVPLDGGIPTPCAPEETVQGILRATQERGSVGPRDPAEGRLEELNRIDLGRLQQQVDAEVLPLWVQLTGSSDMEAGCNDELPILLDPPARDEGPHLSYAIQWFLFTAVVGIGYPILLRRRMQQAAGLDERGELAVDGEQEHHP